MRFLFIVFTTLIYIQAVPAGAAIFLPSPVPADSARTLPPKVEHAEPLYIDLIRDLGARKGEKEWNFAIGIADNKDYDAYEALVEYEFAVADRLGLEIELPFTFHSAVSGKQLATALPANRLESLKTAIQWTFLVSEKQQASFALGYINELVLTDLNQIGQTRLITGNVFNPFLVAAKRIGSHFHTLIYTGPHLERTFENPAWHASFAINSNLHYMIPQSRNFAGIEINKELSDTFSIVLRPQLRVSVADNLLIGIVAGVPLSRDNQHLSSFMRLIWEPGHRH